MTKISSKMMEIFELHCSGFPYVEIAEVLGVPRSFVVDTINAFDLENFKEDLTETQKRN